MPSLKYSRQREAIKEFLYSRHDHPTANDIYENIRQKYPNISLGTVYRNLALLCSLGEITKVPGTGGPDRYDANTDPHDHFICKQCQTVVDVTAPHRKPAEERNYSDFPGKVENYSTNYFGICKKCLNNPKNS